MLRPIAKRGQGCAGPANRFTQKRPLMEAVDQLNRKHGRHTARPLAVGGERGWDMRRGKLSPRYTTQLGEVLRVHACQACLFTPVVARRLRFAASEASVNPSPPRLLG